MDFELIGPVEVGTWGASRMLVQGRRSRTSSYHYSRSFGRIPLLAFVDVLNRLIGFYLIPAPEPGQPINQSRPLGFP